MAARERAPKIPGIVAGIITALLCMVLGWIRPLFHDEASTWYFAGSTLQHLVEMLRQDVHPPAYFLMAWAWFQFATPDLALPGLRIISALLTGVSVTVFLQAANRWLGQPPARLVVACVALSPFLVFCGYFARYYALVCLLWACCLWLVIMGHQRPRLLYYLLLGVCSALLFLTNYAAAAVAALAFFPVGIALVRKRAWRNLAACVVPGFIAVACWSPMFMAQLQADLPGRLSGSSGLGHLLKSGGFLVWTLAVSDGMPPWRTANIILAALLIVAATVSAFAGLINKNRQIRVMTLVSLLTLAGGAIIGWRLLPGPMYSFLPPRVAFCGYAWLTLLLMIPAAIETRGGPAPWWTVVIRRGYFSAVLLIHIVSLWQLILLDRSTNWAYQVPVKHIAATVRQSTSTSEKRAGVYMPIKSFGNIRYELEKMTTQADPTPDIILNPAASDEVADLPLLVIVRDPRSPDWPPADAVKTEGLPTPPGDWHKINSIYFLKEDEAAQNLKARLSGRDVSPYKLQMDVWQRTKTGT